MSKGEERAKKHIFTIKITNIGGSSAENVKIFCNFVVKKWSQMVASRSDQRNVEENYRRNTESIGCGA